MKPFTNSILESSFERNLMAVIPDISELHFQKSVVTSNRIGVVTTNIQVVIQITAIGKSAPEAIRNANEAAPKFCKKVAGMFTNASITILNPAVGANKTRQANRWATLFFSKLTKLEPTKIVGEVAFVNTGLRLTPSPEWEQHYPPTPNPPALIRREKNGDQFLSAQVIGDNYPDDLSLRATQSFTNECGLFVIKAAHPQTGPTPLQRIDYFVTNGFGKVVQLTHLTAPLNHSDEVQEMILGTLRVNQP